MTSRRSFLMYSVLASASATLTGFTTNAVASRARKKGWKHWVWIRPENKDSLEDLHQRYNRYFEAGIRGIFFETDSEKHFRAAKAQKLEAHRWMWTLNRGETSLLQEHPEWYAVNHKGESCADKPPYVNYYRWLCPSREGVAQYLEGQVHDILSKDYVDGVHLDYVRFCDVILPVNLWDKYRIDQTRELPEYDYCYCTVCQDKFLKWRDINIMGVAYPEENLSWRLFRYRAVTDVVNRLAAVAESYKKPISAVVFPTPEVARRIVRQDWTAWNLSGICPMIYHGFYKERVAWIGDAVQEGVRALHKKFPLYAGLYLPDFKNAAELQQGMKYALQNGAAGISLFGTVTDEVLQALQHASAISNKLIELVSMTPYQKRSFNDSRWIAGSLLSCLAVLSACTLQKKAMPENEKPKSLTQYVDPYIGSSFHGHVFVGASVPFGAVQLGPLNMSQGWDWCSGYHYSDSTIISFSHTHLSGTGIGDLGDILLMPATGIVKPGRGKLGDMASGYYSMFSHADEKVRPGYYSVRLKRYNILAELTATERVGFHQYSFPVSDNNAQIVFDLKEGVGWDRPMETALQQINDTTIAGYRFSKGWASDQRIYFTAVFSKPIKGFSLYQDSVAKSGTALTGKSVKGIVSFAVTKGEKLQVKVGISPVSTDNARANIEVELPHWDFVKAVTNADAAWNKELGKVRISAPGTSRMRTFYTALYHTMISPSIFNDHNGDYLGTDKKVYKKATFTNLTTFSLWDTYRAAHPLFTILQPEKVNDMINSMLAVYRQQGKLPVWHLMGNETNTMVGYSGVTVVAEAFLKGFRGFDTTLAYEAVKATAMRDDFGLSFVKKLGYIPADSTVESVAMGLEYSIADWSIAQMAKRFNKPDDYAYFSKRARNYRNYFDPETRFMRGRLSQTEWRTPYSPFESRHRKDDFTEGNGWQYTWLVPQDPEGLMELMGGEKSFVDKLDSLFVAQGHMGEEASSDITGLIGQYAHGNEPSHHITYLYSFAGQPWKTADRVRYILDSLYTDKPDGLCGNEDVGQMSAWYIFSALGFYPVNPASGIYIFGSPVITEATILLNSGQSFRVSVKNNSATHKFIQQITLNGMPYTKSNITHAEIIKGGQLEIEMGAVPSAIWGVAPADRPYSEHTYNSLMY